MVHVTHKPQYTSPAPLVVVCECVRGAEVGSVAQRLKPVVPDASSHGREDVLLVGPRLHARQHNIKTGKITHVTIIMHYSYNNNYISSSRC